MRRSFNPWSRKRVVKFDSLNGRFIEAIAPAYRPQRCRCKRVKRFNPKCPIPEHADAAEQQTEFPFS